MNTAQNWTPELSNKDIIETIEKWTISLSEVIQAVNEKLNKTTYWEVPLEALSTIKNIKNLPTIVKMKAPATEQEIARLNEVEEFLKNTASFRNNKTLEQTLQESNWKKYLVLWDDNIFEIKEQRWNIYIAYDQVKQIYIIYKFVGEKSDKNTSLLWGLKNIEKTNIDWYYDISSSKIVMCSYAWSEVVPEERKESNYYYIWKWWDAKSFGDYKHVSDLQQFWNATFFKWATSNNQIFNELVIHNWEEVKKIPNWHEFKFRSKNGKHLLYISYNLWNPHITTTPSLFDLDTMEFIFEKADEFKFDIKDWWEYNIWILWDNSSYTIYEKRKWLGKILWDKKIKIPLTL